MATKNALSYFSKTVLINLDDRPEKLARMTERLKRAGIEPWERISAVKLAPEPWMNTGGMSAGAYGLVHTHKNLFLRAIDENWETLLIFEDDAVIRDDVQEQFKLLIPHLNTLEWDVFFLGHRQMGRITRINPEVIWCPGVCHTHMFAVHKRAFRKLLGMCSTARALPVDIMYGFSRTGVKAFSSAKLLAVQEPGYSDIANCPVKSWQKCIGWEEFWQHCTDPVLM